MTAEAPPTRRLIIGLALVVLAAGLAVWLPRWWERREFHKLEQIAGVGSSLLSGSVTDARRKIDSGMSSEKVSAAIGKASFAVHTDGASTHDIWTYYYKDGTMTVNLTDGMVQRISVSFGPPNIPKSRMR
ncbi:MAG TPA: hypothetical protein VF376_06265 [Thermoanaerobaculia bacterium]